VRVKPDDLKHTIPADFCLFIWTRQTTRAKPSKTRTRSFFLIESIDFSINPLFVNTPIVQEASKHPPPPPA